LFSLRWASLESPSPHTCRVQTVRERKANIWQLAWHFECAGCSQKWL
jgi:hypothetical protein